MTGLIFATLVPRADYLLRHGGRFLATFSLEDDHGMIDFLAFDPSTADPRTGARETVVVATVYTNDRVEFTEAWARLSVAVTAAEHSPDAGACDPEDTPCDGCATCVPSSPLRWDDPTHNRGRRAAGARSTRRNGARSTRWT